MVIGSQNSKATDKWAIYGRLELQPGRPCHPREQRLSDVVRGPLLETDLLRTQVWKGGAHCPARCPVGPAQPCCGTSLREWVSRRVLKGGEAAVLPNIAQERRVHAVKGLHRAFAVSPGSSSQVPCGALLSKTASSAWCRFPTWIFQSCDYLIFNAP